jgi:hypothetical protein
MSLGSSTISDKSLAQKSRLKRNAANPRRAKEHVCAFHPSTTARSEGSACVKSQKIWRALVSLHFVSISKTIKVFATMGLVSTIQILGDGQSEGRLR